jgi:DNA-binding response OmpR family regulator
MLSILLLEDDKKLASEICLFLQNQDFECQVINDGSKSLELFGKQHFDLLILDISVPSVSGIDVCTKIRALNKEIPILMLTALEEVNVKVKALESGADDYLVKPFHFEELFARIKALLRRYKHSTNEIENILIKDLEINVDSMQVKRAGKQILLTPKEYKLLLALAKANGKTISKQTIAEEVWNINFETGTNTIEVYINFLRNKIDKEFDVKLIKTRPGFGYYLNVE